MKGALGKAVRGGSFYKRGAIPLISSPSSDYVARAGVEGFKELLAELIYHGLGLFEFLTVDVVLVADVTNLYAHKTVRERFSGIKVENSNKEKGSEYVDEISKSILLNFIKSI